MGSICAGQTSPSVETTEPEPTQVDPEPVPPEPVPPVVWTVTIKKDKNKVLGLDIKRADTKLKVTGVKDAGLAKAWNDANPDQAIQLGDMLVKVGSTGGTAALMLDEVRKAKGSIELTFERIPE